MRLASSVEPTKSVNSAVCLTPLALIVPPGLLVHASHCACDQLMLRHECAPAYRDNRSLRVVAPLYTGRVR
jgi:hypothetical protein